jgi:hypothetical protein
MMELNSFPEIWREFKETYSKQSSLLRGLDALALFAFLTAVIQAAYAAVTNGYPFHSLISALCGSLGLMVLAISFRIHLTPSTESSITPARAFVDFLVSLTLLFWFVWNIMI